jgi:hypothetical protein
MIFDPIDCLRWEHGQRTNTRRPLGLWGNCLPPDQPYIKGFYEWDKLGESIKIYQTMNIKTTVYGFKQSMGSKIIDTFNYFMFKQPIGVRTVRFIFFLFDNLYQFVLNPTEFQVRQGHLCLEIFSKNQSVFRNARSVVWLIGDLSDYSQSFLSLWHSDPKPWEPKSEVNWCIWNTV